MKSQIYLFCALFFLGLPGQAQDKPDPVKLLREVDRLYRAGSSYSEMSMTVKTPHWERTLDMKGWSKGTDYTLIRILSPKKDRGISTLRRDREMWNYFPKINKVIKVPPSMMMGSWMGSDFTNDDLVRQTDLSEEYEIKMEDLEKKKSYRFTLTPKAQTATVWGKIEVECSKEGLVPQSYIYYDEDGTKARTMTFSDVRTFDGKKLPALLEMVPVNKEGHKTIIKYKKLTFNIKSPEKVFTLRNLKKKL